MKLKSRLALRTAIVLPFIAALMFVPAGSFRFWQGWVFFGIFVVFSSTFGTYFYRRDPKLLERRLQTREERKEQKRFVALWVPLWIVALALPGLDHRMGWSARIIAPIPAWASIVAFVALAAAWILVFVVLRFNSFASAVVKVEAGQTLVTDGPYAIVRHPMYSGFALMILAAPVALGSYVAMIPALLIIPLLLMRLLDEEKFLCVELRGYSEYCRRTPYRLVPFVY